MLLFVRTINEFTNSSERRIFFYLAFQHAVHGDIQADQVEDDINVIALRIFKIPIPESSLLYTERERERESSIWDNV